MKDLQQFYTVKDVVEVLRLSRPTIHRRIKDGRIPATRIGARILIPGKFIEQLLEKSMAGMQK
jgi:excisionase family DNA binding protein